MRSTVLTEPRHMNGSRSQGGRYASTTCTCSPVLHCARYLLCAAEFTQTLRLFRHVAGEIPRHNIHDYQSGREKRPLGWIGELRRHSSRSEWRNQIGRCSTADSEYRIVSSRLLPSRGLEITSHGNNETIVVVLELISAKAGAARFGNPPGGAFLLVKPIIMQKIEQHLPQGER